MPEYKFVRQDFTDPEEVERTIAGMPEWAKSLTAFLYLFGCRVSEALLLTPEHFKITKAKIMVTIPILKKRDTSGPYQNVHTLSVSRKAPFAELVVEWVEKHQADPKQRLWRRTRVRTWQVIKEANRNLSPHVFRHDRLSKLAMAEAPDVVLMRWAGWSDTRPAARYIHLRPEGLSKFADKIR
ncbi:MAG: site-specific integrase [Candidatus Verstraetearchaeota archaeon]|nr:site-specific integrase [Candidatus Verstraetearchaeota archaeon]